MADIPRQYEIVSCAPQELTETELARCVAMVARGGAVSAVAAQRDLPVSHRIAIARQAGRIVAIAVNKGSRTWYSAQVADTQHGNYPLQLDTPEIGYVVVDEEHRNRHLSTQTVAALLQGASGPVFATTDDNKMKAVLHRTGFTQVGLEWPGHRGQLSLWLRTADGASTPGPSTDKLSTTTRPSR